MKYFPLIWAALIRRPLRSTFTLLSVVVAFVLFGMLQGVNAGFARAITDEQLDMLITDPRVPGGPLLPMSILPDIERVPGVEIGTLRALGFRGFAIIVALLIEAALLALVGAAVGVLLVLALLDGRTISTVGDTVGNNPQLVYSLALSPGLVMTGVLLAVSIGLAGGLFPAARAARLPITSVLRQ